MSSMDASSGNEDQDDLWFVQLASGDVRAMTLDALDAAFQEGRVTEGTYVRHDGADAWAQLGQVLGADAGASDLDLKEPPAVEAEAVAVAAVAAAPPAAAVAAARDPEAERDTVVSPVASPELVPVVPVAMAPALDDTRVSTPPASLSGPLSTSPMVASISSPDIDVTALRSSKRGVVVAFAAVLLVAAAAAVTFTRLGPSTDTSAGSRAPSTLGAAASPVVVTAPDPQLQPGHDGRLSDEQRRALLDADKLRASKVKPSAAAAPKSPHHGQAPRSGPVFHKGGDEHDPLNGSL